MMAGIKITVRTLDGAGLPSPHVEVVFDSTHAASERWTTLLFLAAMIQGLVPVPHRWGTLPVPPDGEEVGRVVLTNVLPAEVPAARELLARFIAVQLGRPYDPDAVAWVADGATAAATAPVRARLAALARAQVAATVPPAAMPSEARLRVPVAALERAVDAAFALGCGMAVRADAVAQIVAAGGTLAVDETGDTPRLVMQLPRGVPWRPGRALALALHAQVEASTPARETWVTYLEEPRDVAVPRWRIVIEGADDGPTRARAWARLREVAGAA